jgi:hypothetical protein
MACDCFNVAGRDLALVYPYLVLTVRQSHSHMHLKPPLSILCSQHYYTYPSFKPAVTNPCLPPYNRARTPVLGLKPNFLGIYFSAVSGPIISRNRAPIIAK